MLKKKNKNAGVSSGKKGVAMKLLGSFLVAVALFGVLVGVEKNLLNDYEKASVVLCKTDVPKGTKITKENVSQYFYDYEVDIALVNDTCIKDKNEVIDTVVEKSLSAHEILRKGDCTKEAEIYNRFSNPVEASITATNGAIDEGYLALQVGSEVVKVTGGNSILIREEFEIKEGETSVTLTYKASGTEGNEVRFIYKGDANGIPADKYTQNASASATEFAYDPESKVVTLPTGAFKTGDVVIVDYYPTFKSYEEIKNEGNKFSLACEVIVDAWFTDLCTDADVPLQLYLPKGKVSGNIDLSAGDQAAVQNIEIEALQRACAGEGKTLWVLRKYDMSEIEA